ncbi:MAG TPA: hypothetical protein VHY30_03040 [Verrucomicrobiae bacterium]|jgi:hypothetical protein|nr:hypothetical protein [Verrucomicrobiae bacterium]
MSSSDAFWLIFWEAFAAIGFIIVIIGVIIEGVEHFKKFPRKENARKLQIEKIGWFLVVVGLAMEFLGDHAAKRISDREDARLNKEAGDARKDAGIAIEQSKKFDLARAEVEKELEQSRSNNFQLKIELAEASANADSAKQFAGDAKTASQQAQDIEAKMPKSRLISNNAAFGIIEKLEFIKPISVNVEIDSREDEPTKLAGQLVGIFEFKGSNKVSSVNNMSVVISGVKIIVKSSPDEDISDALKQIFIVIGQQPDISTDTNLNVDLKIQVGGR